MDISNNDASRAREGASAALDANVRAIASYIREGESGAGRSCKLGFELEHFVVRAGTCGLVSYKESCNREESGSRDANGADANRAPGVEDVLQELSSIYEGEMLTSDVDGNPRIIGLSRRGAPLTIEPGAQVEVSIGPCESISQIEEAYSRFRSEIDPVLGSMGYELVTLGYHPTACANEVPIIPKHRYIMMDRHFRETGRHGICMMRASASCQISIDYDDEADAISKMRVATAIGPLLYFVFDNAPVFEGESVGALVPVGNAGAAEAACETSVTRVSRSGLEVPQRMVRAAIWDDVDSERCMVAPFLFEDGAGYESYARMLMERPPILTLETAGDDSTAVEHGDEPASRIYGDHVLDVLEIEHMLSMFFFDVRLKQYIEIRQPDSVPLRYGLAFAALVRGIFYNRKALGTLVERFDGISARDVADAKAALRRGGYDASVYGRRASEWLDELVAMAREGIAADGCACVASAVAATADDDATASATAATDESRYLEPLAELVAKRTTLVDLGGYARDFSTRM